jgi:hypothetical protein
MIINLTIVQAINIANRLNSAWLRIQSRHPRRDLIVTLKESITNCDVTYDTSDELIVITFNSSESEVEFKLRYL